MLSSKEEKISSILDKKENNWKTISVKIRLTRYESMCYEEALNVLVALEHQYPDIVWEEAEQWFSRQNIDYLNNADSNNMSFDTKNLISDSIKYLDLSNSNGFKRIVLAQVYKLLKRNNQRTSMMGEMSNVYNLLKMSISQSIDSELTDKIIEIKPIYWIAGALAETVILKNDALDKWIKREKITNAKKYKVDHLKLNAWNLLEWCILKEPDVVRPVVSKHLKEQFESDKNFYMPCKKLADAMLPPEDELESKIIYKMFSDSNINPEEYTQKLCDYINSADCTWTANEISSLIGAGLNWYTMDGVSSLGESIRDNIFEILNKHLVNVPYALRSTICHSNSMIGRVKEYLVKKYPDYPEAFATWMLYFPEHIQTIKNAYDTKDLTGLDVDNSEKVFEYLNTILSMDLDEINLPEIELKIDNFTL